MRDTKYLYAVYRVKALENNLLSRNTVERMMDASTPEEALKILGETDYGNYFGEVEGVYDFEKALDQSLKSAYKVLDESTRDQRFSLISRLKYDIHNLKVLLKANYLGEDYDYLLSHNGSMDTEVLKKAVEDRNFSGLTGPIRDAAQRAVAEFELSGDPQRVDIFLDKGLYKSLEEIILSLDDPYVLSIFQAEVDLLNISIFLRVRRMDKNTKFLETVLIDGGTIDKSLFLEAMGEPVSSLADSLSSTVYGRVAVGGIQSWVDTGRTTVFEKLSDDFLLNMAKKGKYAAFGIIPIIGYLKAKENEVRIIRMIMVGKINGIPADNIRERLRDVYV
jgi:V/A-type H+-transporting ATPase subunit C